MATAILDIDTALEVRPRAKRAIQNVLKRSSHHSPILAISWQGSSGEVIPNSGVMGPTVWHWCVWTHESSIIEMGLQPYLLRWEDAGFTFHALANDVDWARRHLDKIYVDEVAGQAKCLWKGGRYEAITHVEFDADA